MHANKCLLLIHGALGTQAQMSGVENEMKHRGYKVFNVLLPGHGRLPLTHRFHHSDFADYIVNFMNEHKITSAPVFGYSMGGYVAAMAALSHPKRITRLVTLGTKWHWNTEIAAKETHMMQPDVIIEKVPQFASRLASLHGDGWKTVLHNTAELMTELGRTNPLRTEVLQKLEIPVTILLGDSDKMVSREESEFAATSIPQGELHLLPDTKHPIENIAPEVICRFLQD